MGYDNTEKKYFSTWIDNMSTAMMIMGYLGRCQQIYHTYRNNEKSCQWTDCDLKEVYKIVDDNNHVMEMYGPDPKTGKEYKMMEIKYTRKK